MANHEARVHTNDLDAMHYRNHSSTQYTLNHELLREISFQGKETILDIGCGDGRITAELAKHLPQGKLVGIDSSAAMINLATQSFPNEQYPNLEFKKISAETLQIENFADIALVLNALHWIRDPWKALSNIVAALKPSGKLIILTYPKESTYWLFLEETLSKEMPAYKELSAFKTILTTQEYHSCLTKLGMQIDCCSTEERVAIYPTAQDLKNYIKGWFSCYLPLSADQEEAFLQSAIHHARSFSLHDTELHLPYLTLKITSSKNFFR